ncbi:MAG: hypothetical protein ACPGOV_04960 [Magnetovibrionaceae bacterium]
MAKKAKPAQQARQPGKATGKMKMVFIAMTLLTLLIMISLPTLIILGVGMAPSLVAFLIDRSEQKYATFCVTGMNFCGVFPYIMDLWLGTHSISLAWDIIGPFSLMVMYAAAAFGWMMFMALPPVVSTFLTVVSQQRILALRSKQRRLVEEWGEEVSGIETAKPDAEDAEAPAPAEAPPAPKAA